MHAHPDHTVHLLFKTHLDIGFTAAAETVVNGYLEHSLPKANVLANAMRNAGSDRFVWTVGSWLVHTALERLRGKARTDLESALDAGDIRWHGLPLTMHTEYLDVGPVRHGLALSAALNRHFGRRTRSAKTIDVPGHTQALVPLLVEAGIELLHIGVSPASTRLQVPPWCRWRCAGAESILGYEDDYGGVSELLAHGAAIACGFTGDNHGPPELGHIQATYQQLRQRFPDRTVAATSLDDFTSELSARAAELPLITDELGGTWIHGTGTDPEKTRRFRALTRWRRNLPAHQSHGLARRDVRRFSDSLLVVGEHTWGRDGKYFPGARYWQGARALGCGWILAVSPQRSARRTRSLLARATRVERYRTGMLRWQSPRCRGPPSLCVAEPGSGSQVFARKRDGDAPGIGRMEGAVRCARRPVPGAASRWGCSR